MFELDCIITMKKKHVCGSMQWKVIRTGADIKIECLGCKRQYLMPRYELEKKIKKD